MKKILIPAVLYLALAGAGNSFASKGDSTQQKQKQEITSVDSNLKKAATADTYTPDIPILPPDTSRVRKPYQHFPDTFLFRDVTPKPETIKPFYYEQWFITLCSILLTFLITYSFTWVKEYRFRKKDRRLKLISELSLLKAKTDGKIWLVTQRAVDVVLQNARVNRYDLKDLELKDAKEKYLANYSKYNEGIAELIEAISSYGVLAEMDKDFEKLVKQAYEFDFGILPKNLYKDELYDRDKAYEIVKYYLGGLIIFRVVTIMETKIRILKLEEQMFELKEFKFFKRFRIDNLNSKIIEVKMKLKEENNLLDRLINSITQPQQNISNNPNNLNNDDKDSTDFKPI